MTKIYALIASFFILHFMVEAQSSEMTPTIDKTQVELVYNHYLQDGNKSAITGGIGTEKLTVYGPGIKVKRNWNKHELGLHIGSDIISSASTDNIDFIKSSASILDARSYIHAQYTHTTDHQLSIYGGLSGSIESDYFAQGCRLGMIKKDVENLANYSFDFQAFKDDLRWGRLTVGVWKPIELVYPKELRFKEWFDIHHRYSYNLKLGYQKAINKRAIIGIFPLISYQTGLLSTPFHRVYFNDNTIKVEKLPNQRLKLSLGLKWNQYIQGNIILKNSINPYIDNWGITAITFHHESAIKQIKGWTFLPNVKWSIQKGSSYYSPYLEHQPNELYYTSDADLASHHIIDLGFGVKWTLRRKFDRRNHMNGILIRYNYLYRSDGLNGHILSCVLNFERISKRSFLRMIE